MNISQIRKLTSTFSTVGNEMGINPQTLNRDVADIFAGKNVQRTSLGMQLGLTNEDIEKAKASAEGLYAFLEDRLSGYAEANENFKNTIEGAWQHLEGVATLASSTLVSQFEPAIVEVMNAVADYFGTIETNEETGEQAFVPKPAMYELMDALEELALYIASCVDYIIAWAEAFEDTQDPVDAIISLIEDMIGFVVISITTIGTLAEVAVKAFKIIYSTVMVAVNVFEFLKEGIWACVDACIALGKAMGGDMDAAGDYLSSASEHYDNAVKAFNAKNWRESSDKMSKEGILGQSGELSTKLKSLIEEARAKSKETPKSNINPNDIGTRFPPSHGDKAANKAAKEALKEAKRHYEEQKEVLKNALEDIKEQIKKDLDHLDALNEQGIIAVSAYYQKKEALEAKQAQADVDYYKKLIALTQATPYEHETDKQKELLKLQRSLDKATDQLGEINKTANYIKDISQENQDNFGYLLGTQSNLIKDSGVQINNEGSQSVSQSVSQSDSGDPFKVTGKTNEELAYRFFTNKAIGFNDNFARGIIGALMGETEGLNPKDPGGGIEQMDSYRWGQLVKFANDNHSDVYSIYTQLANLVREITTGDEVGSWKKALELIKEAGGTAEAVTRYYTEKVLRPQDHNQGIIRANTKIPILNNILADANKNPQPQSQVTTTSPQSSNMYAGKPAYLVQGDMYGLDSRYVVSNHPRR